MRYEMFEESSRQPLTSAEMQMGVSFAEPPAEVSFECPKVDAVCD
jgi:hypothetical protein